MDWIKEASEKAENKHEILSYNDYMELFKTAPNKQCRPTYEYLKDMLEYFGKNEDGSYKLFTEQHDDSPAVYGQAKVQESFVQNLNNFREEGFNNKFILLVGPNGSSKSSLVKKLMTGSEIYSESEEGDLYSFSWVFPIDNFVKGSLGFAKADEKQNIDINTYAYLEDKDVNAILGSELKDHPILLIPIEHRQALLNDLLAPYPKLLETIKVSYLYNGDLSKRNRMIYDALLKNYKGQHSDVLKHIKVERFKISRRYSSAAVTIEPQIHVDAKIQQITMDKRLASLPPSLQSLNLFSLHGEAVLANRGILEFSDLLKRPIDTYKYLLMTMETRNLNLQGILTELDIFFVGTSNEIHLAAFKQHPDFNSFKGRFNFIRVPYLLNYQEEVKIYQKQVEGLKDSSTFEPYALEILCLFSVMSRLRNSQVKNYTDKKLANIVTNLNPLEKAIFIATGDTPERLDVESRQILRNGKNEMLTEFEYENLYEGKFGLSPRDMKNIIYKLSSRSKHVTIVEILDTLEKIITKKNEYDFLNMTPQADYHHPARFIALIKEWALSKFDTELRDSLGMVDARSYEDYIRKYIENINSFIKGEKVKNAVTGKNELIDEYFIKEFETNINLKEDVDKFRSHLISKLGAYSLDNPGKEITYSGVFESLAEKLKESFRTEQKKVIQVLSRNINFYESELHDEEKKKSSPLSTENRDQIDKVIENLQEKFGYSQQGAMSVLKVIIKERY